MKKLLFYSLGLLVLVVAYNTWAYQPEDCVKCHKEGGTGSRRHISVMEYKASIHGRNITCQDCHAGVKDEEHETARGVGVVDCGQCHEQENRHVLSSQMENRPQCHSCHTKHRILGKDHKDSSIHPEQLKETCKGCHPEECGETNTFSWLPSKRIASHKKGDFARAYAKGNCLGCHQGRASHGEEGPLNDQDCYKCHISREGANALWGYIHPKADLERQPAIFAAATIYQFSIVVLLWVGLKFYIRKFSRKS